MTENKINYSALLTPEIEAQMPKGLTGVDAMNWRKRKMKQLVEQGYTGIDGNVPHFERPVDIPETNSMSENEAKDAVVQEQQADSIESSTDNESDTELTEIKQEEPAKPAKAQTKKSVSNRVFSRGSNNTKAASPDYEDVRSVHKSVMAAMRKALPGTASKADLLAAFVYIHTNGDCEISDNAMSIVKAYKAEDRQYDLTERTETRLANIERMLREQRDMIQSVELCTCYNTYDRRYGSKEPRRAPKDTEFREQGNLDMLARLRTQAKDQHKIDDIEKGRAIYAQTKDKND